MFQLRPAQGETWHILNTRDEKLFTGSLRQCEDWLDHQENLKQPRRRPLATLATRLRSALHRLAARPAGSVATTDKCEFPPQPKFR